MADAEQPELAGFWLETSEEDTRAMDDWPVILDVAGRAPASFHDLVRIRVSASHPRKKLPRELGAKLLRVIGEFYEADAPGD